MTKKLTILFAPNEGVGHVNACIGLAEVLKSRGHKIVFAVGKTFEGKLTPYGFQEELLIPWKKDPKEGGNDTKTLARKEAFVPMSSLEKVKLMTSKDNFENLVSNMLENEPLLKEILAKHKPDLFIIDSFIGSPQLIYSDKPWVYLWSGNPLITLDDERTPPGASGFSSDGDSNSEEWKSFRALKREFFSRQSVIYNKWLKEKGFPTIDNNRCIPYSPYLNIYGYPQELDYTDIRPLPDKWMSVDAFMRKGEPGEFILPEKLAKRDQKKEKLIFLSLGSMGSANIELMEKLVNILSKSPHKVIVSKGVKGDEYELADNMWGKNFLPQTKLLSLVDLVITHGGNNTITETFSFGKPMIVMPLFGDQYDNAQRIHEKGFGLRMDGQTCTEEELLEGIEKLLSDNEMKERLNSSAKRMASSKSLVKVSEAIERLVF